MASLDGSVLPGPQADLSGEYLSQNLFPDPPGFGGDNVVTSPRTGTLIDKLPISMFPETLAGVLLPGFGSLYYQGIHVIPPLIDVGNLLQEEAYPVEVWNATESDQALTAIDEERTDGIILTGPEAPPTTFLPLESRFYEVDVSLVGPAKINALFTFQFTPNQPTLTIVGWRITVFDLRPDWSRLPIERLAWLTDVLEGYDGAEQRIRLRGEPRREFEWLYTLEGHEKNVLEGLLFGWQSRLFAMPVWMDRDILSAELLAGSTAIPVTTQYKSYVAGGLALLWMVGPHSYEAVDILTVEVDRITLAVATEHAWPVGTALLPLTLARIPDQVDVRHETDRVAQAILRFAVRPGEAMGGVEGPAPQQYQGLDLFLESPNRVREITDEVKRAMAAVDFETGAVEVFARIDHPKTTTPFEWLLKDRQEIAAFKAFLEARKGRLIAFWSPSWQSDVELAEPVHESDLTVSILDIGYRRFYQVHPARRDLAFRLPDGSWRLRRIESVAEGDPGEEVLTLDQEWGDSVQPVMICWLSLCRLNTDQVELVWENDSVVRVTVARALVTQ